MQIRLRLLYLTSIGLLALVGCSSSLGPIPMPKISSEAGQAAIKQYDSDGDQTLNESELAKAPALKRALARIDKDNNKKVTADEINERIKSWGARGHAITQCTVTVRLSGQPLSDAQVKFVPEKYLGEELAIAQGVTNGRGMAPMKISDEPDGVGANLGFYRVEISKIVDGKETIPAKYNTDSELGIELASDVTESVTPVFDLQSR
jgi:hypothetical protein